MLKWAVAPRLNADSYEQHGNYIMEGYDLLSLNAILEQNRLPCLVRLPNDDIHDTTDNYCLLLSEISEPYLMVSNETDRFSIPLCFDGLFAPVDRGVTRYNVIQSVRSLQSYLKSYGSSNSSATCSSFSHFTTLQPCMAYSNSALRRIRPGTILELRRSSPESCPSPSPSTTSSSSSRIRSFFSNLPHTLNKHFLSDPSSSRLAKKQTPPPDYLEVKSIQNDENFCLKSESVGIFVPVYTQMPPINSHRRTSLLPCTPTFSSSSSNQSEGLYTVPFLSQLTHQYPLITELIISRTVEENVPTSVGYPLRRSTLHRRVEHHRRIIAFDMKNYAFLELDTANGLEFHVLEHDDALFQRYQAQLRWCNENISSFRSQIKIIVHSSNGTAMFVQATPLRDQHLHLYHPSNSNTTSPITKHIPNTIFTSPESISSMRSRGRTPSSTSKFNSALNGSKLEQQHPQQRKGQTTGPTGGIRKDVRVYFNDPSIQTRLQSTLSTSNTQPTIKRTSFHQKNINYRTNSAESESVDDDDGDSYQCTAL